MMARKKRQDAHYDHLQSCMLRYPLTNGLPLSTQVFPDNILPIIQMWVYIHRIVGIGSVRDNLLVNCIWFLVGNHTRLCDFLAHDCSQTYWEEINDMFSSNKEILTELFFLPPPLIELPLCLTDFCSHHNLHLLVLSSKSRAGIHSYHKSHESFVRFKTTGRHGGCESTSMQTRWRSKVDKQTITKYKIPAMALRYRAQCCATHCYLLRLDWNYQWHC